MSGEVTSVQAYYELIQAKGCQFSGKIADHIRTLKDIEKLEQNKTKQLAPLVPMVDQLKQFMSLTHTQRLADETLAITALGGQKSQYYEAAYALVKVMLVNDYEKQRGVIFHGKAGSGKTHIAKRLKEIFDTHWYQATKGNFDEQISRQDADASLIIMNEANLGKLFNKDNLPMMKTQLEGLGRSINNKFHQPFQGFFDAFSLITCNGLAYPYRAPESSTSGFTKEDHDMDRAAMEERCMLVHFPKHHKAIGVDLDEYKLAQCMLAMYENWDKMPPPKPKEIFKVVKEGAQEIDK